MGIWSQAEGYQKLLRADATVDYWEGEETSSVPSSTRRSSRCSTTRRPRDCRRSQESTPEQVRANLAASFAKTFGAGRRGALGRGRDADGVPVRIYRPVETDEKSTALVYFHGGGWVAGSVEVYDPLTRAFAKRAGCVVDLRRLPARARASVPGGARRRLDGDEVGDLERRGAQARRVEDRRRRRQRRRHARGDRARAGRATTASRSPRSCCIYPITSHDLNTPSYSLYSQGYLLTRDAMQWYWEQYLGEGADGSQDPDVSPAAERDLRRLPRAIVVTAEADVAARRGRGLRAAALHLDGRDGGLPLRRHGARLPAHGRRRSSARTRRSTRSRESLDRGAREGLLALV